MNPALHSSERHDWETPDEVLELVRKVGRIGLDPCTTEANPCDAETWFFPGQEDGLKADWCRYVMFDGTEVVYVNPPYGRGIRRWIQKCCDESKRGAEIVALVPSRTDTAWFRNAWDHSSSACFWQSRIVFRGAEAGAPFPSAVFYWGPKPYLFAHVFSERCAVVLSRS